VAERAAAEREAAARARAAAERETTARAQQTAQQQAQNARTSSRPSGVEGDGTIRDRATGRGLFYVDMPAGWAVIDTSFRATGSSSRPCLASVTLEGPSGGRGIMGLGEGGTRNGAGMKLLMLQYGAALAGADTTNYADMPNPLALADERAQQMARNLGAGIPSYLTQLMPPDIERRRLDAQERYRRMAQQSGGAAQAIRDAYASEVVRIYGLTVGGHPWNLVSYVRLYAAKLGSELPSLGGGQIASALGSLFGGKSAQPQQPPVGAAQQPSAMPWCSCDYASYVRSGTIYWSVEAEACYAAPAAAFDAELQQGFLPLVTSLVPHGDLESFAASYVSQEAAAMQGATNVAIDNMNRQHHAAMEANRQVQAAFDAQLDSWHAASDAHHRQFRENSNAAFNGPSGGSAGDFSEAIRGVNTYTTSDGREVEVDVRAERVWENQAGDVYATDSYFEPGPDWTELPRS
jgi:hypothetical protein